MEASQDDSENESHFFITLAFLVKLKSDTNRKKNQKNPFLESFCK